MLNWLIRMLKTAIIIVLFSLSSLVAGTENNVPLNTDSEVAKHLALIVQNMQNVKSDTLGNLIKNYHLGKSVLIEKPDRGSDVSLVEITISLSIQRNSPYICAAGEDYIVICRSLKGGIISDIYSTNNIIIHDNKFCENNNSCFSQDNK